MSLFSPRVFTEIFSDMLARLLSATALTDVNYGSVWTLLLEAAAQEDDEQYFQMLEIIRGYSLDSTTGTDLDNRAEEYSLERIEASESSTTVTIRDSTITKIVTGIYSGLAGAAAGSNTVNGDSATGFPTTGSIIVGRGTPNVETLVYSSITTQANYVTFNLTGNFANDHGTDETIILSQGGNRVITSGTEVKVPASDTLEEISFTLDAAATILDGNSEVTGVAVTASQSGTIGNVPVGAIRAFGSAPFTGATVTNPTRVTNGVDDESDQALRDRIKSTLQSLSRGTPQSIVTGVQGLISTSDNKRVVSATLREATVPTDVVKLFIDDGTGFIPEFNRVGLEVVVPAATGGEKYLSIGNTPLMKAFTETQNAEPYNISHGEILYIDVNGVEEAITFVASDFAVPGSGTAQEVLTKINSSSNLTESRVSSNGVKLRIFSRSNNNEEIRVVDGSANVALGFQTDIKYTTKLYLFRDNVLHLLVKDGKTASIECASPATYNFSAMETSLAVIANGAKANIQNIWFVPSGFVNATIVSVNELVNYINARITGFTAKSSSNNTRISLASMLERDNESSMRVVELFDHVWSEEGGTNVDRTVECAGNASNVQMFVVNLDYVYLGHADVPFDTVYVNLLVNASADLDLVFEYWNGSAWTNLGVHDGTLGFTQSGHLKFMAPTDWAITAVDAESHFWLRLQRTAAAVVTPPTESRIKICGGNEILAFSETEEFGANRDYTLNRFVGQIELVETLNPNDKVTLGSNDTRAFAISEPASSFSGLVGQTLTMYVDGITKTVTFVSGDFVDVGAATLVEVVRAINSRTVGITASVFEAVYIKLKTNRMNSGSFRVDDSGANNTLNFPVLLVENFISHQPALVSNIGPFTFATNDYLIIVVDDNLTDNFLAPLYRESTLTGVTDPSTLIDSTLNNVWQIATDIVGYEIEMIDGTEAGVRRVISTYVPASGTITTTAPFPSAPLTGDTYQILPVTAKQVKEFWNNNQITLLQTKAEIKEMGSAALQLASLSFSEDAAISVTGGPANTQLGFG